MHLCIFLPKSHSSDSTLPPKSQTYTMCLRLFFTLVTNEYTRWKPGHFFSNSIHFLNCLNKENWENRPQSTKKKPSLGINLAWSNILLSFYYWQSNFRFQNCLITKPGINEVSRLVKKCGESNFVRDNNTSNGSMTYVGIFTLLVDTKWRWTWIVNFTKVNQTTCIVSWKCN